MDEKKYQSGGLKESDWFLIAKVLENALDHDLVFETDEEAERASELADMFNDPANHLIPVDE